MTKLDDDHEEVSVFEDEAIPLPETEDFSLLNDETISQEQINEMKMLGIEKPESVTWARWQRIQDIRFEHEHMIHLAASGQPQHLIAEQLGYDQVHVSKVLATPEVRKKVMDKVNEIYGADYKKAVKDRTMKALGVVDEVLDSGPMKEKAPMARWLIEHTIGKASQDIQVTKTTLSEVIVKIEEMKQAKLRDVNRAAQDLPREKDHFDTIIDQVIPKGMVIGKRSEGNSDGEENG